MYGTSIMHNMVYVNYTNTLRIIFFPAIFQVFLKDTDERACAYIAGPAPNRWGFSVEGNDLFETISSISRNEG